MLRLNFYKLTVLFVLMMIAVGISSAQATRAILTDTMDSGLGGGNAIEGMVLLPSGQRLSRRVRVRLSTMTRGDITSMTDDAGRFAFRGLVNGDYTVTIDGEKEFEAVSQTVTVMQFRGSPAQVYNVSMRLTLAKNEEQKTGVVNAELANVPPKAVELYNKALELSKERDHQGAIGQLELAIKEFPGFILGYNEIGYQYLLLNEYEKSAQAFQAALKIKPDAILPLTNYGIVLTCQNKFKEAEAELRKVIKLEEKSAVAHYYLAYSIANQSKFDEVQKKFLNNRFDEAEKEFLNAVKYGGDSMKEAHRYLAVIYSSKGDKKHQLAELETYLQLAPNAADAEQLRSLVKKLKEQ